MTEQDEMTAASTIGTAHHDLLIVNGRVHTPLGTRHQIIAVDDGRITSLLDSADTVSANSVIDAEDCHVLPGLVDSHVHFRTPGLTHKEDWAHGSRAAAAGGVTTVIDMPNTDPPLLIGQDITARAALVGGQSLVDYRFDPGVTPETLDCLKHQEAVSVKIFMAGHHTAPNVMRDRLDLERAFVAAAERGIRLVLHAEDDTVFALLDAAGPDLRRYEDYEPARPRSGGIVAVAHVIELVRRHGTRAHILHVSSAEEVALLRAAKRVGLPLTFEVTGHHLSFTAADTSRLGARIRLSPAIRSGSDQSALWQAVIDGDADTLGSDHAPHTIAEKSRPVPDAPPGIPGVQELATAVFTGLRRRYPEVPVEQHLAVLARQLAANPAELFGIGHRKGSIAPGMDADFAFFDPGHTWMLARDDVQTKASWSAYEGWTMTGRVMRTVRRGRVIWDIRKQDRFGDPEGIWLDADHAEPVATDRLRH